MTRDWHDHINHLIAVAEWAIDEGELDNTARAVLYFFEKSRNYHGLFEAYDNHLSEQGELQDERRATL